MKIVIGKILQKFLLYGPRPKAEVRAVKTKCNIFHKKIIYFSLCFSIFLRFLKVLASEVRTLKCRTAH